MSWRRSLLCWLVAGLVALLYLCSEPVSEPAPDAEQAAPAPDAEQAAAPAPDAQHGYVLDPATLVRVEIRRGERTVVLARTDDRWTVVVPTDRTIPAGLVAAFVEQLVDSGHGERIADDPKDPAFGLASPRLLIDALEASGARLSLVVGARTPAGTAAYALVEQSGQVVLVGLNLLYYADLLLD